MPTRKPALTLSLCVIALAALPIPAIAGQDNLADPAPILLASANFHDQDDGATTAQEPPEFGILFVADGVENTFYTCSACHSEMIVAQQGLTRAGWEKMLAWMTEEQGMMEIEEPDLSEILDYLAANYNEDRPNFPRPLN